jgi:hypothetical protein
MALQLRVENQAGHATHARAKRPHAFAFPQQITPGPLPPRRPVPTPHARNSAFYKNRQILLESLVAPHARTLDASIRPNHTRRTDFITRASNPRPRHPHRNLLFFFPFSFTTTPADPTRLNSHSHSTVQHSHVCIRPCICGLSCDGRAWAFK